MKNILMALVMCLSINIAQAQNSVKSTVIDKGSKAPICGVTVKVLNTSITGQTGASGTLQLTNIPNGTFELQFSHIGYKTLRLSLSFPLANPNVEVLMEEDAEQEEVEEVTVSATRSSRTISRIPTRVEVISGEELDEKANMKPGDIRMLLAESTGIQTQQTSATSGNTAIRIQGLDGKYTQIIRDGFPLYSGFSSGLGLLQIAPLDLSQVEVIKGSSSTLYGGGAISGLVNLVSKKPTEERQLNFLLNGTSALGLDASGFYAQKFEKVGITMYGAYNKGTKYDPSNLGLTAIPEYDRFTFNPKVYFYLNDKSTLHAGLNLISENRLGGDMKYEKGNGKYFELNKTNRLSTQLEYASNITDNQKLVIRNSVNLFGRSMELPNYNFSGNQTSTYTEGNYSINNEKTDWVLGANLLTDQFKEDIFQNNPARNYAHTTIGLFAQNTYNASEKFSIETGVRGDYHNEYGFFFLPKFSALYKINDHFSTRLGAGMGYKAPTIFTEEAERIHFENVLPIDVNATKAERSFGASYDINYSDRFFDNSVGFSINHMFFYTRIKDPILLNATAGNNLTYSQPNGYLATRGMETNAKITYGNFKLFVGYTFADVCQHLNKQTVDYTLVSKHRLNNVLMYEIEEKWKIGAEAYYFSKQKLNDGQIGKSYWTAGFLAERIWERFSVFINFENLTDTRQTKFDTIYTGSISNPTFRDIYAPVDGFVFNGGVKIRL